MAWFQHSFDSSSVKVGNGRPRRRPGPETHSGAQERERRDVAAGEKGAEMLGSTEGRRSETSACRKQEAAGELRILGTMRWEKMSAR